MRQHHHVEFSPAAASVAAALSNLIGCDPDAIARALHHAECRACLSRGECDGIPTALQAVEALAFISSLEMLAVQAMPSFRAYGDNRN